MGVGGRLTFSIGREDSRELGIAKDSGASRLEYRQRGSGRWTSGDGGLGGGAWVGRETAGLVSRNAAEMSMRRAGRRRKGTKDGREGVQDVGSSRCGRISCFGLVVRLAFHEAGRPRAGSARGRSVARAGAGKSSSLRQSVAQAPGSRLRASSLSRGRLRWKSGGVCRGEGEGEGEQARSDRRRTAGRGLEVVGVAAAGFALVWRPAAGSAVGPGFAPMPGAHHTLSTQGGVKTAQGRLLPAADLSRAIWRPQGTWL